MQIIITNKSGSFDISNLIVSVIWSGSRGQCSRTLTFGLLTSSTLGIVDCALGSAVLLRENNTTLFSGFVFERTKSTVDSVIDVTCFDTGYYLKKNQISRTITSQTAEAVTSAIAAEFGITCGELATTNIKLSRNFLGGYSLYDIISTLYTLAAEQTGIKYIITFCAEKLCAKEIGVGTVVYLKGGSNLIDATVTESNKNLINSILVLDKNGNTLFTKSDDDSVSAYGTMQQTVIQQLDTDINNMLITMLKSAQPEQKITVTCLGNNNCITGNAVMLTEPVTGLSGKYYIDSDTHIWRNGIYTNKLVLTFEALADEKNAGSNTTNTTVAINTESSNITAALEKLHNAAT